MLRLPTRLTGASKNSKQFSITIEFSIFDMATVVLLPTLTFGPIEEPEEEVEDEEVIR